MKKLFALCLSAVLLAPMAAQAEEEEDDIWALLDDLPARTSWDLGVGLSYGNIGFWRDKTQPWTGYAVRGTYGGVINAKHRLGGTLSLSMEGPFPVFMTVALEPMFSWDFVSNKFQVGASVGPSFLLHESHATIRTERYFTVAPMVAARIGYSNNFSRLGRRFFVLLEPRFRLIGGGRNSVPQADYSVAIVVGSGKGR